MVTNLSYLSTRLAFDDASSPSFYKVAITKIEDPPEKFASTSVEKWFQIIPADAVVYRNGEKCDFSKKALMSMVEVFGTYRTPVPIDYGHSSMHEEETPGPIKIAGYLIGLGVNKGGLWGLGKFTAEAASAIRDGIYLFNSPVIQWDSTDRKTGKKVYASLYNVALTVNPAIDGQEPIKMSKTAKLADQETEPKIETEVPAEDKEKTKAESEAEVMADGEPEEKTTPVDPATALYSELCDAVGVDLETLLGLIRDKKDAVVGLLKGDTVESMAEGCDGMSPEQKAAVAVAKGKMSNDTRDEQIEVLSNSLKNLSDQVASFKAEKAAFEAKAFSAKVEATVEDLLATGYMLPAQKEVATKLFRTDFDTAKQLFSTKVVHIGEMQSDGNPEKFAGKIDIKNLTKDQEYSLKMFRATVCKTDEEALKLVQAQYNIQ
jgi:phage I-like protein